MTTASLPDVLSPAARSFATGPHRLLIGGERCDAADERSFETIDPSTGRPIAPVAYAGAEDVDRAVRAAREAFVAGPWRSMPASQRGTAMMRLADLIESHADELAELEALDNGKPVKLAKVVDVRLTVEHVRYFAGWPTKIVGETLPVTWPNAFCYTRKEPVGGGAGRPPRREQDRVHRLHRGRPRDRGQGGTRPEAGDPRARRQVAEHHPARRRPRRRGQGLLPGDLLQHRPGLQRRVPAIRAARAVR